MVIPVLDSLDLAGKTLTADALLTQRKVAPYLIDHQPHYVFTVKDHQPTRRENLRLLVEDRGEPDFHEPPSLTHGRIEQRAISITTHLTDSLDFPAVGQAFVSERHTIEKNNGKTSTETAYGLTSHPPESANAAPVLGFNRGHWSVENGSTTSSATGTGMKIVAPSTPVTAPRMSPHYAASPSASSNPGPPISV